jgi:hypothetical protein
MNCSNCGMNIAPDQHFCPNCGQPAKPGSAIQVHGLGLASAQMLVALFMVWIIKAILNGLAYVRSLSLPVIDMPMSIVVDVLAAIALIVILVRYARALLQYWPQRFPAYPQLGAPLAAIFYLIAISQLYQGSTGLVNQFFTDPLVLTVIQAVLLVATLVIIVRAARVTYHYLPAWIYQAVNENKDLV